MNYSALARSRGLILHTTVGIGYETPWRQVEAMLLEAAERTPGLLREPAALRAAEVARRLRVVYEINVYCNGPAEMPARSTRDLHQNILDVFNEYGVQIMTPAYEGDPEQPQARAEGAVVDRARARDGARTEPEDGAKPDPA